MTKEMTLNEFVKEYGFEPYLKDNDFVRTALSSLEVWNRKKFTVLDVTDTSCIVCVNGASYHVSCRYDPCSHEKITKKIFGIHISVYDAEEENGDYRLEDDVELIPALVRWIAVLFKIRVSCENAMENARRSLPDEQHP